MENRKKCPECGCEQIGKGSFKGYASMTPYGKIFSMGSEVVADVCSNCGLVLSLRVLHPEKFKK
jgi:predicted nucleic-acid-binding Zn-ribbon protein